MFCSYADKPCPSMQEGESTCSPPSLSDQGALQDGRLDAFFVLGSNMLASFADGNAVEQGLQRVGLVVAYDIFMNETIRRCADLVLPGTIWLESLG